MKKLFFVFLSIFMIFFQNLFSKEKIIAKIPEASGICYSKVSNTLFVVNDEGTVYELTTKGKILRKQKIGDYDLEAITIDEQKGLLLLANEKNDSIIVIKKEDFKEIRTIKIKKKYKGIKVLKKGSDGIEGLTLYKNKIYASNQSKKKYPKEDSSVIVILDYDLNKDEFEIEDIIDLKITDISGLTFYKNNLYLVSDKNSLLISYNFKKKEISKEIKLSKKFAQEGIAFDKKGDLYIADDKGKILKMSYDKIDE